MNKFTPPSPPRDEGERPFWISYADLMTALMILFLVVMVAALGQISHSKAGTTDPSNPLASERESAVRSICAQIESEASRISQAIVVDCSLNRISFGEIGTYKTAEYTLSPEAQTALHQLIPHVLQTANSELGRRWLKQVVVEGFTDTDGSYLYNLNLSLKRSEWLMCAILGHASNTNPAPLDETQRRQVKQLFLIGGVSFNNNKSSKEASRRVELRLQFYGMHETPTDLSSSDELEPGSHPRERCHV
ncbi:MAG TPA: flagellar motor protein MotB [Limnobacter sp.]|nr:flagellar motor protein MotB [Limnobacter sp.]